MLKGQTQKKTRTLLSPEKHENSSNISGGNPEQNSGQNSGRKFDKCSGDFRSATSPT